MFYSSLLKNPHPRPYFLKKLRFCHKLKFSIVSISLQPNRVNLGFFKLKFFDKIVWYVEGLLYWFAKIYRLYLWQKLNSFSEIMYRHCTTGTVLPALYYRHLLKEDLKPTIPLDKNKNIYWIFCMCTEYIACVLNIYMWTEYLLCVLNILYVYWIFFMCSKYFVCVLNILYV